MIMTAALLGACGHHSSNSPVSQYISLLDQAAEKAKNINSITELVNVQDIISPQETRQIIFENKDYVLDDNEKKELKKSYDNLLRVAYEKTAEIGNLSDSMKKDTKKQVDMIIDLYNKKIEAANTLGDLLNL